MPRPSSAPFVLVGRARPRLSLAPVCPGRRLHASRPRWQQQQRHRHGGAAADDHYARLGVRRDASPAEIKKSFYALSKTHHPDVNPSDPHAARSFSLLSESYTVLSDPSRRAAYDRDVLALHHHQSSQRHPRASYSSTAANPAGGRAPSGLSRRRGSFRGPAPSFYRNGGWGAHADARRRAHEESTGTSSEHHHRCADDSFPRHAGMGPGSSPFGHDDAAPPHFDRNAHARTHETQDRRRWQRSRRAVGDDDVEFEPQTSLAGHFLIVAGILGATFLAPVVYLQFMRLGHRKRELE
ncbi:DnaJ domain-containing protein [Hirsutella rhossiliensis]|uniref:DnaJ domain-containing protein n=1 Tax=Hirsutella rhossiliensis TaxID=111463 RepID=A0A9P8SP24_9HYPO|nr:dnaJ domain-containing protein [Hirsutella rhossiliensis]KAH0967746.1 dnaJ domain-containing protein [Hirsutella rhossiliensis]